MGDDKMNMSTVELRNCFGSDKNIQSRTVLHRKSRFTLNLELWLKTVNAYRFPKTDFCPVNSCAQDC